jgi:hypothetical protein
VAERHEDLRAADADRAKVADRLRVALEEGRLDLTEYDERLQQAYAAKTYGDLDPILADLPGVASASHSQVVSSSSAAPVPPGPAVDPAYAPSSAAPGSGSVPRWLLWVWGAWLSAVLVNVAIWAAVSLGSGHVAYFWPIWVAGPWGALLLARTLSGLARGDHYNSPEAGMAQADGHHADRWTARAERYAARNDRRQARRARYR